MFIMGSLELQAAHDSGETYCKINVKKKCKGLTININDAIS